MSALEAKEKSVLGHHIRDGNPRKAETHDASTREAEKKLMLRHCIRDASAREAEKI